MRKKIIFGALAVLTLVFFACEFNIPKTIEITGSPSIRFVESVDIGTEFRKALDDSFVGEDGMTIYPCINTANVTYLVYMKLFEQELAIDADVPDTPNFPGIDSNFGDLLDQIIDLIGDTKYTLAEDIDLVEPDPITIPFSDIGSTLSGFTFDDLKTHLYFSGSSIFNLLKIEVIIDDDTENPLDFELTESNININSSISDNKYTGTAVPSGGIEFPLPFDGEDKKVSCRIYIPEGTEINLDDLEPGILKIEAVVWFPFKLTAGSDAVINFPDDVFKLEGDLFGRKDANDENLMLDIIENLRLEIKLDNNPFHK